MADKPTVADPNATLPDWTPVEGEVTEPSGAKKADGWNATDVPPASMFNWFWKRGYQWLQYLDAHTSGFASVGNLIDTAANAVLERFLFDLPDPAGAIKAVQLARFRWASEAREVRIYLTYRTPGTGDPAIMIVGNAKWDNTVDRWDYVDPGQTSAVALSIGVDGLGFNIFNSNHGSAPWQFFDWRRLFEVITTTSATLNAQTESILNFERRQAGQVMEGLACLHLGLPNLTALKRSLLWTIGSSDYGWRIQYVFDPVEGDGNGIEITNAIWDNGTNQWSRTNGRNAWLFRITENSVRVLHRPSASGNTWNDDAWDEERLNLSSTPVTRWTAMHWSEAINSGGFAGTTGANTDFANLSASEFAWFRIPMPTGAKIKKIRVDMRDGGVSNHQLRIVKHAHTNVQTGTMGNSLTTDSYSLGDSSSIRKTFEHDVTDYTVDHEGDAQSRAVIVVDPGAVAMDLFGIAVEWEDPEPARY